jgi:hypothetical protein
VKPSLRILGAALTAAILACAGAARADQHVTQAKPAPAGSWVLIGQTHASHSADHDGIVVKGPFDNFRAVKFKVTDAPLEMRHMVITYGNGQPDQIDVRQNIPKGGESRVIDLKGVGTRHISRIDFWYETKGLLNGKADVTVFGRK